MFKWARITDSYLLTDSHLNILVHDMINLLYYEITCFVSNFYLRVIKFWQESLKVFEVHAILFVFDGWSFLTKFKQGD